MAQSSDVSVYQFKVTLQGSKPPIWRRIQVKSNITLGQLHRILQIAMGWDDSHLHQFIIHGTYYGSLDQDFDGEDEEDAKLNQVISDIKDKFIYEYDFGDGWEHAILLEKILPLDPKAIYPVCLEGKLACPPDDCGGIYGYYNMLEAIQDPKHAEHDDMLEWMGGDFNPEEFNLGAVNAMLQCDA